jgi:orotate phosphoribosyltransferase
VVVVEDLISTGGSSLKAVEAIRNFGCDVVGMVAIYTHGFPVAEQQFEEAKVSLTTLSNYDAVIAEAVKTNYIDESEIAILKEWRKDPANWSPYK